MLRVLGIFLLGAIAGAAQRPPLKGVVRNGGDAPSETIRQYPDESDELVFLVQIAERASDRVLSDIRAFNAVAYALLGPVLAIVTFLDYKDAWNFAALPFALAAVTFSFRTVLSGDGYPSPHLSERFLRAFKKDPQRARRVIIRDLRKLAPENDRQSRQKRRDLGRAAWSTLAAVIAAVGVKSVESVGAIYHGQDLTTGRTVCAKNCSSEQNASWLLWRVEPRAGVGRGELIRLRPCNWTRSDDEGLGRAPASFSKEDFAQTALIVSLREPKMRRRSTALRHDTADPELPDCSTRH